MTTSRNRNCRGFTLVEVTLAVAIFAVGIIAVLGLLPTGLQSARAASDRTIAAMIANDAFSQLRVDPFGSAYVCTNAGCTTGVTLNLSNNVSATYGYMLTGALPATSSDPVYFRVNLTCSSMAPGLSSVRATIVWPAAAVAPANTNIFITQVAWYDR
jgi:type IV pilus assembly protein PilV